jgi:hypothetical protein
LLTLAQRKQVTWLAMLLVGWMALAPLLSHGVRAWLDTQGPWQDVCSAAGTAEGLSQTAPSGSHHGGEQAQSEHCSYCYFNDLNWAPAPANPVAWVSTTSGFFLLFAITARNLLAPQWLAPPNRAPPV